MLAECEASVRAQTFDGWEHLIQVDEERLGCAVTVNRLAYEADSEWLVVFADDDLMLPGCLDALLRYADSGDVIYSPPLVWGVEDPWWFFDVPPKIPSFGLIRSELWRDIGGYETEGNREEDRRFWTAAMERDARFVRVSDQPTWVYRIHAGSKSFNGGVAS